MQTLIIICPFCKIPTIFSKIEDTIFYHCEKCSQFTAQIYIRDEKK